MASSLKTPKPNRLLRLVTQINRYAPEFARGPILSLAFNSHIKYAGTTGIAIQHWNDQEAVVHLKNRWRVQNHLHGIHATAMATLAESATGMVFGLHVPDGTHVPVLKSLRVDYQRRCRGDLKAVATISPDQIRQMQSTDKGSAVIAVQVTDETGQEPIQCQMEWAWTTAARRRQQPSPTITNKGGEKTPPKNAKDDDNNDEQQQKQRAA